MQIRARAGISAGEQGHLVAQADQFVDQPRNHPLCPAVKPGRNALGQRRDLGNPHDSGLELLLGTHARTKKAYRVFLTQLPILPEETSGAAGMGSPA